MVAAQYPLTLEQGTSLRLTLTFTHALVDVDGTVVLDPDTGYPQPGDPYDFTGCTARMDVRFKVKDALPVFSLMDGDGIELGGTTGTVTVSLTADRTELLGLPHTPRIITAAVYDLEVTYPSGDRSRLIEGPITIRPSVTRSNDDE